MGRLGLAALLVALCLAGQGSAYARTTTRVARLRPTQIVQPITKAARLSAYKAVVAARQTVVPIVYPTVGFKTRAACDAFWRPIAIAQLKLHGIYSSDNLYHSLNVIWGESRGGSAAHTPGTQFYGLVQFGTDWVDNVGSSTYVAPRDYGTSKDWRMDAYKSLQRMMRAVRDGGHSMWTRHWGQTCG